MEFKNLGLAEPIVRAVAREGYTVPTPIQQQAIPHVLAGSDLLGCARTGTGKTAAFALPILHRLTSTEYRAPGAECGTRASSSRYSEPGTRNSRRPRALILAPTRELASQIGESFRVYGHGLHLSHTTVFGGVNQKPQVRAVKAGVDVLIATPGRLMDLVNQRHIDLRGIEIFVLDEADRMLDMGFIPDIRKIIAMIPEKRQTLLFSATMPREIRALADSILHEPVAVQVDPVSSTVKTISQSAYFVAQKSKGALLRAMLAGEASGRTLVFTRTKHGADRVVKELNKAGIRAAAIHGNKNQNARTRALSDFKSSAPPVLVATDIASRGIDVDDIAHVINFDMPVDAETYVHRIGRTARAGASGAAVTFCCGDEGGKLRAIERLTGERIAVRKDQPEYAAESGVSGGREDAGARAPNGRSRRAFTVRDHGERALRSDRENGGGARRSGSTPKPRRGENRADGTGGRRTSKKRSIPRSSSATQRQSSPHAGSRQRRDGEIISTTLGGRAKKFRRGGGRSAGRSR